MKYAYPTITFSTRQEHRYITLGWHRRNGGWVNLLSLSGGDDHHKPSIYIIGLVNTQRWVSSKVTNDQPPPH